MEYDNKEAVAWMEFIFQPLKLNSFLILDLGYNINTAQPNRDSSNYRPWSACLQEWMTTQ